MFTTLAALADRVADGARVGVPPDYSGVAMALSFAIARRNARDLRVFCLPQSGLQVDVLIGAGAVVEVETAAVSLGEYGLAPCFTRAVEAGTLAVKDSTCPALHAALTATERGVPFLPLRGLLGSDLLRHRPDYRVIDNPFAAAAAPLVLVPAVKLAVALFHAPAADSEGNVWIGRRRELATLAHAAEGALVTVERVVPGSFFETEATAAGALSSLYVEAIAEAPGGAAPLGLAEHDEPDAAALRAYAQAARSETGFRAWLAGALEPVPA